MCVPAGRGRPLRGLRRSRQERHSKDATKLFLLYDDHILDNDPLRESKDVAFAQSYLRRVRALLCFQVNAVGGGWSADVCGPSAKGLKALGGESTSRQQS